MRCSTMKNQAGAAEVAEGSLGPAELQVGVVGESCYGDVVQGSLGVADGHGQADEVDELENGLEEPDERLSAFGALLAAGGTDSERGQGCGVSIEGFHPLGCHGENSRVAPRTNRNGSGQVERWGGGAVAAAVAEGQVHGAPAVRAEREPVSGRAEELPVPRRICRSPSVIPLR